MLYEIVREQQSLQGQVVSALQVAGFHGCVGLSHEGTDLLHHGLLILVEREAGGVL